MPVSVDRVRELTAAGVSRLGIGRACGCTVSHVLHIARTHRIPSRRPRGHASRFSDAQVLELAGRGWTHQRIADELRVTRAAVSMRMKRIREGVRTRTFADLGVMP